ncbi:MAG: helix-turn-helix domain-containing protein, partial [Janthinobacterium lividum]
LVQLMHEDEAVGQPLDRWIGESGVDLSVLSANLRSRGAVRFFSTTIHGEHGASAQVEVSAVAVPGEGRLALGYAIRNVSSRLNIGLQAAPSQHGAATRAGKALPRSVEQLTELIGRVSLKELVRESTEVIERLAIEAALELTGDNRASAAEMLGLSRQSLYVKLRRYGIGDLTGAEVE